MKFEEFCDMIKSLDENMSIGIHGIKQSTLTQGDIGIKILNGGLELHGWGGLISSVKMYGRVKDLSDDDLKRLYEYSYGIGENGEIENIIFGFPEVITNSDNNSFYLGYYNQDNVNGYAKGQDQAGSKLPLNLLFEKLQRVPNNFIIGCIKAQTNNPNIQFINNNNFYGYQDNQEFYDNLYATLYRLQIINPVDFIKNADLYQKFGISGGLALEQYEEYLSERKEKTN